MLGAPNAVLAPPARLSSSYGERVDPFSGKKAFHEGVDFAGAIGAPIHAPGPGSITFAGEKSGTGKVVEISISAQQSIRFAHLQDIKVTVGDKVKAGDVIGTIGTDANSTGPHVHIEVYQQGQPVDPQKVDGLILLGKN